MHGVGLIDDTLFPLTFAPTLNEKEYFTRNHAARITLIEMGWSGSVHNNRIWSNREISLGRDMYLNHKEYLLGDSAFSKSSVMILTFKKGHNASLIKEKKYFNTKLAKVRIKGDHCIGSLKSWFQHL